MSYLRQWVSQFPIKNFKRNHVFFRQGDVFQYCYYITSGICARTTIDDSHSEIILKYYFHDDIIGLWYCLRDDITECPATFIAKTDGYAYVVPANILRQTMNQDFEFYRHISNKIINSDHYIENLYQKKAKGNAAEIVCYTIISLLQKDIHNEQYLAKSFSHTELSMHLRLHRVTVSKIFTALQRNNVLEKHSYGWKILDYDQLHAYASGKIILKY